MYPSTEEQIKLLEPYSIPSLEIHNYEILKDSYNEYVISTENPKEVIKLGSRNGILYNDKIINEGYVGLFGISQLHSPNFAKVLGIGINKTSTLFPLCDFVIYEYVPGISFRDYLITASEQQVKEVLKKIFSALYYAYSKIGFLHNDLHTSNIIIKPDGTPVIIDYGNSRFNFPNTYQWRNDIYTLLSFTIQMVERLDDRNTAYSRKPKPEILQERLLRKQFYSSNFLSYLQILEGSLDSYSYEEFLSLL